MTRPSPLGDVRQSAAVLERPTSPHPSRGLCLCAISPPLTEHEQVRGKNKHLLLLLLDLFPLFASQLASFFFHPPSLFSKHQGMSSDSGCTSSYREDVCTRPRAPLTP